MLDSLHIENIAVIQKIDVDFTAGLCVITGETGAGKSVMLDAIAFLLGAKATRELLRNGAPCGEVSAVFSDVGPACEAYLAQAGIGVQDELMLQRTLSADGKSKCRLNGRAVPLALLRELSGYLVSIHAQNDNQMLLKSDVQHQILDNTAELGAELSAYRTCYQARKETETQLRNLHRDSTEQARLADILRFQIAEIDAAKLKAGEEEVLLQKRAKLQNAEKIAKQSEFVYRVLYGSEKGSAALILERAATAMQSLSSAVPEAATAAEKLLSMRYEVEDIANTARDLAEDYEGDPTAALNRVEERLDTITKLRRKYGEDETAILAFRAEAAARLSALENSDETKAELEKRYRAQTKEMRGIADRLHAARVQAAEKLSAAVLQELAFLDMPSVRFEVCVRADAEFHANGADTVEFLIATNPGEPLLPLSRIASGGELARIMLALKSVLNDRDGVTTAVFDEVDTGISGKTSRKIGIKLSEIGKHTQVLCVTHSAQIASLAATHYKIVKNVVGGSASSTVIPLDDTARVEEVARILGGLCVTDAQMAAARDMIEEGRAYR
ncbi:MAG: DNA repair protein RecN [Ruminococcaceae bacterium]|nr:DNA repair protein RecN [Oscillospiraceae bacterium]